MQGQLHQMAASTAQLGQIAQNQALLGTMAQTQMGQTGIAANTIAQQQAALAQSLAETQAMQGAVAMAAQQQNQTIAHQLHQVGEATMQNAQMVAMAGARLQENQHQMTQEVMRALHQMAQMPHSINQTSVTNVLNQYGITINPSMVDAAMRVARGGPNPSQLAWHSAALHGSPAGQAMAHGMAAIAPQHQLTPMDANMAPMSVEQASSAPLAIVGPQGNVLSIEDGVAMVPPAPPRPTSPSPPPRREALHVHKDTAEVAARVIKGQLSLKDGQDVLSGRGRQQSLPKSPPRSKSRHARGFAYESCRPQADVRPTVYGSI